MMMKSIFLLFSSLWLTVFSYSQNSAGLQITTRTSLKNDKLVEDSISITMPVSRIIYQRSNKNIAAIKVSGTVPAKATLIVARLVARTKGQGTTTMWKKIATNNSNGAFSGLLNGRGGWYNLEVRAKNGTQTVVTKIVERIGIGEVFLITGHSVAQGGDINIEGATDDRVSTIRVQEKTDRFETYLKTGDPQYLPELEFVQAATGIAHAPFGHNNYFWSKFGEILAQKENVPVLIYNAGFGGTSLEHWAKSTQNIQFEHGFVRSAIRMPYINVFNALQKYIPSTGIRAILSDQGQNDSGQKNADSIVQNYQTVIRQARQDLKYPKLAMVVNRQTPKGAPSVRIAQNRMAKEPYCFSGPDYDLLLKDDTVDGVHLSASGEEKAAVMWAQALTPDFFKSSKPWLPLWK